MDAVTSPYLTVKELQQYIKVCRSTINNYVKDGTLKKHRLCNSVRFIKDEVDLAFKEVKLHKKNLNN
jgi:excisionase family DNA binding protein